MIKAFIAIFVGGGVGSVARYAIQLLIHRQIIYYEWPWSTFAVNIIGSFVIGCFYALSSKFNLSEETRLLLTTGLCGGFTTFSTFSADCVAMFRQGHWVASLTYICLSIILGILACMAGATIFKSASSNAL